MLPTQFPHRHLVVAFLVCVNGFLLRDLRQCLLGLLYLVMLARCALLLGRITFATIGGLVAAIILGGILFQ
jgi:hypothetical protein